MRLNCFFWAQLQEGACELGGRLRRLPASGFEGSPEVGGEGTDAFKEGRVAARWCLGIRSLLAFV